MKVELRQIIRDLLGDIYVNGETYHDTGVFGNIDFYKEALDEILDSLGACSMYEGDSRMSRDNCGRKAKEVLKNAYTKIGYFIGEE